MARFKTGKVFGWSLALLAIVAAPVLLRIANKSPAGPPAANPPFVGQAPTGPTADETYRWRRVAIGGGGFLTGYAADPGGTTRVVRADVYGAYIWRPDQDRWVQLVSSATMPERDLDQDAFNEGVFAVAVAPSDPQRIYMAVKGLVFRSDNAGATFAATSRSAPFPLAFDPNSEFRHYGPFLAVSPRDPDLLLFGTPADGLWRSADGGRTWQHVASVPHGTDLRPAEPGIQAPGATIWFDDTARDGAGRDPEKVHVFVPGQGLYVSTDGGRAFASSSPASPTAPTTITRGAFAADGTFFGADRETRSVWRLRDGFWTELTAKLAVRPRGFTAIAINPRNGDVFAFDEGGRPFRSSDGGESWLRLAYHVDVGRGDPPWLRVNNQPYFAIGQVRFDPVVPDRLWVVAGTGVYFADIKDDEHRIRWISQTRGIEELVANDVVRPTDGPALFAGWDFGIHVKEELDRFSTTYGPKERLLIAAQQLDWSPADPKFIVTNASDTRTFCCWEDGDAVLAGFSTDGGRTWSRFATLPHPPGTRANDPWRMSFGSIAVSAGDTRNIVWLPSYNRAPFFTRDRGASWQRIVFPGETLPATGSHAAFHFHRKTLAADRVASGVFYLMHSGDGDNASLKGVWRTQDGGENWTKVLDGEIAPASQYSAKLRAVPGKQGHLFYTSGVSGNIDTRLRRSVDGGASWTIVPGVDRVDDVGFGRAAASAGYPTLFISGRVAGQYGIWRSTDDASTWTRVGRFPVGTLDQVTVIAGDPNVFGRVFIGYKGSGWIYGEPAACRPAPYRFPDAAACSAVGSAPK